MANTLTAFNPAYWTPTMQKTLLKESVALGIANTELRADLKNGDTLHKPYGSYPRVQTYTKGTDINVKDISSTDESLAVNTTKVASFYVDDIDRIQNKYDTISEFATIAQRQLNNVIDQAVIAEYSNAGTTLDDGSIGGTAGNGIVSSTGNISDIFTASGRTLNAKKRLGGDRFALVGPRLLEKIQLYVGGRETGFGEEVGDNGMVGKRFGFSLKLSNNLPFSATCNIATAPSNGDTVVINGVTFTFRTSLTGSATLGEVLIGGSASAANTNLAKALNDSGTVDTHYSALSDENRQLIEEAGIVATAAATSTAITGYGDIVVSETFTDPTDTWASQLQYSLMGITGAIDLVTQVAPNVEFRDAQLRLGKYVHPWTLYGKKTFFRMKDNLVAVKFDVSSWV